MKFDILSRTCDIHRHYLLEASAGTGKTYSIEHLVVRLLIETKEPLALEQILVVTFTRAATRDLKKRIRTNMEQARNCLLLDTCQAIPDYLLAIREMGQERLVIERLEQALFAIDQLQVYTIHGFCSRMLGDYAFEAGLGFDLGDEGALKSSLAQAVTDFLRTGLTAERWSPAQLERLLGKFQNDIEKMRSFILRAQPTLASFPHLQEGVDTLRSVMQGFRDIPGSYLLEEFGKQASRYKNICARDGTIKPDAWKKAERFASLFDKSEWQASDLDLLIADDFYLINAWDPSNLKKGNQEANSLSERLRNAFSSLLPWGNLDFLLKRLVKEAYEHLHRFQREEELLSYDGLLDTMREAVEKRAFCSAVRSRYRAAVIDEFQDTDPIQWQIFNRLFLDSKSKLYLVGDPKQSIYAFRNADIYTYLDAAQALGEEHHAVLDTNFRSHPALVGALNHLFSSAKEWIALPRYSSFLPYRPVEAGKKEMQLPLIDSLGAIHFCVAQQPEDLLPYLASEIERLHQDFGIDYSAWAILVSDRYQANRIAQFLKSCAIPILVQRQEALAQSPALSALKQVIEAVLHPRQESGIKRALGSPLIGWTHEQLHEISEPVWATFFTLGELLKRDGFTRFFPAFLSSVFHTDGKSVAERLLQREEGSELYDDLLQICEWVLSRSPSEPILKSLKFLEQQDEENGLKRLVDRERRGVQIVTIHASKGLEFEIVCPIGLITPTKAPTDPHEVEENDAEKMRQLYVALTRAIWRLYLPVINQETASPLQLFMQHLNMQELLQNENITSENVDKKLPSIKIKPPQSLQELVLTHAAIPPAVPAFISSYSSLFHQTSAFAGGVKKEQHVVEKSVHTLPAGSQLGNLLHQILEAIPLKSLREVVSQKETIPLVQPYLKGQFLEWQEVLAEMVYNAFYTPLPLVGDSIPLVAIGGENQYRETEFLFPWDSDFSLEPHVPGFLKGVIDLLFVHEGMYYLLDWKSNRLGASAEDYASKRMERAMQEGGYILQARIYIEALRRYLSIVDKRPFEDIFGGILYVFLRGLNPKLKETPGVYRLCQLS